MIMIHDPYILSCYSLSELGKICLILVKTLALYTRSVTYLLTCFNVKANENTSDL